MITHLLLAIILGFRHLLLTRERKKYIETLLANREYVERFFATAIFKNKPKDRFISVKAYKPRIQR